MRKRFTRARLLSTLDNDRPLLHIMARLRRDTQDSAAAQYPPSLITHPTLRIVASGTLFLTHTLELPSHPSPSTVHRAKSVAKSRGGAASACLSILAQFPGVDAKLVASLSNNDEGKMIIDQLEKEGVSTRYCKIWEGASVPSAWVLHAADTDQHTIINHNPLPDITHEEFVTMLGPLLIPENYAHLIPSPNSPPAVASSFPPNNTNAPFEWLHFEGRSVKTTLHNMVGIDGLARERKWRNRCVFSVDVGRKARQGVQALMPHADVIFVNAHYAKAHSPAHAATPRSYLLSLAASSSVAPHALLIAYWGNKQGAAVLSLPTKEYFQSSGWVRPPTHRAASKNPATRPRSVTSDSIFWADGGIDHSSSSSNFTLTGNNRDSSTDPLSSSYGHDREDDNDSEGTETGDNVAQEDEDVIDEIGAQEAFVAGMIFALTRKILPGEPYTPHLAVSGYSVNEEKGKWRLEECLKFATELAGRKATQRGWNGLAKDMSRAGWFDG